MAKHNALQMFGRSGNPALNAATFKNENRVIGQTMTLQGTVNKTGFFTWDSCINCYLYLESIFSVR